MSTTTNDAPPGWTPLRGDALPCLACGVSVQGPHAAEDVETFTAVSGRYEVDLQMTRCQTCEAIRDAARLLLAAHPEERARIGSREIAEHRLELALLALDAAGVTDAPRIDALTNSGGDVRRLIAAMAVPGGRACWSSRFSPRAEPGLSASSAAPSRWAGVTPETRRSLQEALARVFASRYERPVQVLAPLDDRGRPQGCALCGVGAVESLPSRAAGVWFELDVDPGTIGGREAPEPIEGVVCAACDAAVDAAGAVGETAMLLSVRAHLGVPPYIRLGSEIDGIVGWAALGAVKPNSAPWAHIELTEFREEIERLGITPEGRFNPLGIARAVTGSDA